MYYSFEELSKQESSIKKKNSISNYSTRESSFLCVTLVPLIGEYGGIFFGISLFISSFALLICSAPENHPNGLIPWMIIIWLYICTLVFELIWVMYKPQILIHPGLYPLILFLVCVMVYSIWIVNSYRYQQNRLILKKRTGLLHELLEIAEEISTDLENFDTDTKLSQPTSIIVTTLRRKTFTRRQELSPEMIYRNAIKLSTPTILQKGGSNLLFYVLDNGEQLISTLRPQNVYNIQRKQMEITRDHLDQNIDVEIITKKVEFTKPRKDEISLCSSNETIESKTSESTVLTKNQTLVAELIHENEIKPRKSISSEAASYKDEYDGKETESNKIPSCSK